MCHFSVNIYKYINIYNLVKLGGMLGVVKLVIRLEIEVKLVN